MSIIWLVSIFILTKENVKAFQENFNKFTKKSMYTKLHETNIFQMLFRFSFSTVTQLEDEPELRKP